MSISISGISISGNVVIVNGEVVSGGGPLVRGTGPNRAQQRSVSPYAGITLDAPAELAYTAGSSPAQLIVSAPENILPLIITRVEGDQLVIRLKGCVSLNEPIQITAVGPSLSSLRVSGTGTIDARGLSGRSFRVLVSGSGSIYATGQFDVARLGVSGSGGVDLSGLKVEDLDVDVSGSGNVHAHATRSVNVDISGSGSVSVAGNPTQRDVARSGSGRVAFR